MTFDVTQFELDDTAIITMKNARGDDDMIVNGAPVTIEIYSPGSPQGAKALNKAGRAAQLRMFRSMRGDFDPKDAENADRERVDKLVAITKAINNFPVEGGAQAIYANPRLLYMTQRIDEEFGKLANFSKPSTAS